MLSPVRGHITPLYSPMWGQTPDMTDTSPPGRLDMYACACQMESMYVRHVQSMPRNVFLNLYVYMPRGNVWGHITQYCTPQCVAKLQTWRIHPHLEGKIYLFAPATWKVRMRATWKECRATFFRFIHIYASWKCMRSFNSTVLPNVWANSRHDRYIPTWQVSLIRMCATWTVCCASFFIYIW